MYVIHGEAELASLLQRHTCLN
uniref:Uncharacterized protein n=1 Tax=Rhizophora mucronata TaxID=61149 RepID=A0A2P2NT51_RHIMU